MPPLIHLIGRYANGLAAVVFAVIAVAAGEGVGMMLFFLALAALSAFNVYVIEKSARALGEEEWMKAELRKLDLRRRLAEERENEPPGA